jgi:hypothetical protein
MSWKRLTSLSIGSGIILIAFPFFVGEVSDVVREQEILLIGANENRQVSIFLNQNDIIALSTYVKGGNDTPENSIKFVTRDPDLTLKYFDFTDESGYVQVNSSKEIIFTAEKNGPHHFIFENSDSKTQKSISLTWVISTTKQISVISLSDEFVWLMRSVGGFLIGTGTTYGLRKRKDEQDEKTKVHGKEGEKRSDSSNEGHSETKKPKT